jgi:translation initiation factor IF-3
MARELGLDLVEVAEQANPPVARIMDFGKYKYEAAQKAKESRRHAAAHALKEMKYRPKIGKADFDTKTSKVERFLSEGHKVKITIMFRGREQHRPELGLVLLERLATDVAELGFIESSPKQDGRNMIMVLGPHKKKAEAKAEVKAAKAERAAERQAEAEAERAEHKAAAAAAHASTKDAKPKRRGENLDEDI